MARFLLSCDAELAGNRIRNRDRAQIEREGGAVLFVTFEVSEKNSREAITETLSELEQLYDQVGLATAED